MSDSKYTETFHQFIRLPVELQQAVWRECLPRRVRELDIPFDFVVFGLQHLEAPSPCSLWRTTYINGRPPVISRVCRTSRTVAFEDGNLSRNVVPDIPPEDEWHSNNRAGSWQDPVRDSVHLNWVPQYEGHYDNVGNPLRCLAWFAASCTSHMASLFIDHLQRNTMVAMSGRINALRKLPSWSVVMRVIVAHADVGDGVKSSLFGLLGDARVRLIDVSDEDEVNKFYDFAEECETKGGIIVKQDFSRDPAETFKQKLRDTIVDTFGSEAALTLPPMHPVIMFRLCTAMCNRSGRS